MMTNENKMFINTVISIPAKGMEEWYVQDLIGIYTKTLSRQETKFTPNDLLVYTIDFVQKEKVRKIEYNDSTVSIKMNNGYSLVFDVNEESKYIDKLYLFSPLDGNGLSE